LGLTKESEESVQNVDNSSTNHLYFLYLNLPFHLLFQYPFFLSCFNFFFSHQDFYARKREKEKKKKETEIEKTREEMLNIPNIIKVFSENENCVTFDTTFNLILTANNIGELFVYNFEENVSYKVCTFKQKIHDGCINQITITSPQTFVTCSDDGTIKFWSLVNGNTIKMISEIKEREGVVGFGYFKNKFIYSTTSTIKIHNKNKKVPIITITPFHNTFMNKVLGLGLDFGRVKDIKFFSDGSKLFVSGHKQFCIYDNELDEIIHTQDCNSYSPKFIEFYKSIIYMNNNKIFNLKTKKLGNNKLKHISILFGRIKNNYFMLFTKDAFILFNVITNEIEFEVELDVKTNGLLYFSGVLYLLCTKRRSNPKKRARKEIDKKFPPQKRIKVKNIYEMK